MPNSDASARVSNSRDDNTKEAFISPHFYTLSSYERSFSTRSCVEAANVSPRPSIFTYPIFGKSDF